MKRFLKYAALIATVLVVSSSAWALTYDEHITVAPNNKGDALIFPWFQTVGGGWGTKLTVINTDEKNSVVAKVVIRSFQNSEELLDFLLYLSPADVWTGKIYVDAAGKVKIWSDDDSVVVDVETAIPVFATKAVPMEKEIFQPTCVTDSNTWGYVDVVVAAIGELKNAAGVAGPGVSKEDIFVDYGLIPSGYNEYLSLVCNSDAKCTPANVLAGYMEFGNPLYALSTSFRATTFKNYWNTEYKAPGARSTFGVGSLNSLMEIEAALSKNYLAMPYISGNDTTYHVFTFPTKQTIFTGYSDDLELKYDCKDLKGALSPFFQQHSTDLFNVCVAYSARTFDVSENYKSPIFSGGPSAAFCSEVNYRIPVTYPEGWARYNLGTSSDYTYGSTLAKDHVFADNVTADASLRRERANLRYTGAPVIGTFVYLGSKGLSGDYASWTDSKVSAVSRYNTVELPDYQYSQATTTLPL